MFRPQIGLGVHNRMGGSASLITIEQIISDYGYLNAWGNANLTIAGTSTTSDDYLLEHNLANPAATNQPAFSASDADFNSEPSLSYDGVDDYLTKSVTDYRGSDTTGIITAVFNLNDDTAAQSNLLFTKANSGINTEYINFQYKDKRIGFALVTAGAVVYSLEYAVTLNLNQSYVASVFSNGSTVKLCLDGVIQTFSLLNGTNAGEWLDVPTTDNISIGARVRTSIAYGKSKSAFIGYSPYTTEARVISMGNDLRTLYGIITIEQIFDDWSYTNLWAVGNKLIAGTTTTLYDYNTTTPLDASNPTATSQPTLVSSDANFNGNSSLSYDGVDDYLINSVSDFRGADSTGVITIVFNLNDETISKGNQLFALADSTADADFINVAYRNKKIRYGFNSGGVFIVGEFATELVLNQTYTLSVFSNGSLVKLCLDGLIQTFTNIFGTNAGQWLDIPTTDNIAIGSNYRLTKAFGKSKQVFTGYSPYTTEADIILMQADIDTHYGI